MLLSEELDTIMVGSEREVANAILGCDFYHDPGSPSMGSWFIDADEVFMPAGTYSIFDIAPILTKDQFEHLIHEVSEFTGLYFNIEYPAGDKEIALATSKLEEVVITTITVQGNNGGKILPEGEVKPPEVS